MRVFHRFLPCVALLLACDSATGPRPTLDYETGRVTALIDAHPWRSSYFPDSLVAFYDTTTGRLQVIGQEVRPQGAWPTLIVVLPSGAREGSFGLTMTSAGQVAVWTPGIGAAYISAGVPGDSVWVERLDLAARRVRGSFQFLGAPLSTQTSVYVVGRFEGTLQLTGGN